MAGRFAEREISKALPSVPILLHTVNNIPTVIAEAKKFGIRRVVGKGGDGDVLLNAIQEELATKPQGIAVFLGETTTLGQDEKGTKAADSAQPDNPPRSN